MKFKIKSFIYFCKDMKAMSCFYADTMGLTVIPNPHFAPEDWLELGGGGFRLCLHRAEKAGSAAGNRNKSVFWVEDVAKARRYLLRKKIRMGGHMRWTEIEACDGRDPEGNKFQIAGPKKKN